MSAEQNDERPRLLREVVLRPIVNPHDACVVRMKRALHPREDYQGADFEMEIEMPFHREDVLNGTASMVLVEVLSEDFEGWCKQELPLFYEFVRGGPR